MGIVNIIKPEFCSMTFPPTFFMTQSNETWMRECELNECSLLFKVKLKTQLNILESY